MKVSASGAAVEEDEGAAHGARESPARSAHGLVRRRAAPASPKRTDGERAAHSSGPPRAAGSAPGDGAWIAPIITGSPETEPSRRRLLAQLALATWLAVSLHLVLRDLLVGGLGDSNSKFVSFLASVASCVEFRLQKRQTPRSPTGLGRVFSGDELASFHAGAPCRDSLGRAVRVLVGNLWAKFGSATVGSLLVRETPVLLKGPRHVMTFVVALGLVQLCPRDVCFATVNTSKPAQFVLRLSAALYKLRKLVFVTLACKAGTAAPLSLAGTMAYACVVAWVINDGNSNLRAIDNWLRWRGFPRSRHAGGHVRARALLLREALVGLAWAARRFALLALLTASMMAVDAHGWRGANRVLRALALAALLRRQRVDSALADACRQLWTGSLGARRALSRRASAANATAGAVGEGTRLLSPPPPPALRAGAAEHRHARGRESAHAHEPLSAADSESDSSSETLCAAAPASAGAESFEPPLFGARDNAFSDTRRRPGAVVASPDLWARG